MLKTIPVHGHTLRLYLDYAAVREGPDLEARLGRCREALSRLPREHIAMIVEPIIVVDALAGGRRRGGGWYPPVDPERPESGQRDTILDWLGERNVRNTGVPASEILSRIGGRTGTGIISITSAAFLRDVNWGMPSDPQPAHKFTLLHEVAHSVDFHSSLTPPASLPGRGGNAPYQGQAYEGGALHELAAEAYSRFFLRPGAMCRGADGTPPCVGPDGSRATGRGCPTQRWCSARLQRDLQNTAAFRMTAQEFPLARTPGLARDEAQRARYAFGDRPSRYLPEAPAPSHGDGVSPWAGWRRQGPFGTV